jgi:hypothetical protein
MYDVSIVTDALRAIVTNALAASPIFAPAGGPDFAVGITCQHPENRVHDVDCELNLYLVHVTEDRQLKNSFWSQASISGQPSGQPARQPVAFEPLCLDLYFLVSAHSKTSYVQEQRVMSIALRALHEHATIQLATPTPTGVPTSQITLTLESRGTDELSRLWQALNTPLRMAAEYRAAVVMLTPEAGLSEQPKPTRWTVAAAPADDPQALPIVFGTSRRVNYHAPGSVHEFELTPAAVAPGQDFVVRGRGLRDSDDVVLIDEAGTELDIGAWRVALNPPYVTVPADGVPIVLRPPVTAPPAGRYRLCVVRGDWRSEAVPLSLAPWIDPATGPLIASAGNFEVAHVGNAAELRLGSAPMRRVAGAPAAGEWQLAGTTVEFAAPPAPPGTYAIGLREADVEADPALWAVVA